MKYILVGDFFMLSKKNSQKIYECITEQVNDVENCVISFEAFMRAATTPETVAETLQTLALDIQRKEENADISLRRMIDSLSGSFLPSTRQDLITIATRCDKIANKCESIALMTVWQQFRYDNVYNAPIMDILAITHEQFLLLKKSIILMFTKFGDLLKDHSILDEIRAKESQVDVIESDLYKKIFASDISLAEKLQMQTFIEHICDISDVIENIADELQIMLITRKA